MGCPCFKAESKDEFEPLITSGDLTEPITRQSFDIIKVIGRGNFGKVCLVKKKETSTLYAMKILKKSEIDKKKQKSHTLTERKVLSSANCPFIVKLFWAFQSNSKLYMVLEYMAGGELFFHLSKEGTFSELRARFYCGEILLALEHLHSNGILYRDLKPENILLDNEGHIRLTDFGLSKNGIDSSNPKAYTFCGTPEYLAPEILKNQGHGPAVDFWSFGAVLYYMISGAPPFYSKNKNDIFKHVLNTPIEKLPNVTGEANDLFQALLKINPSERLTSFEKIKNHPWFEGLDWEALASKRIAPPFKPKIKNIGDTSNFDVCFTKEPPQESLEAGDLLTPATNHFTGFTYQASGVNIHN